MFIVPFHLCMGGEPGNGDAILVDEESHPDNLRLPGTIVVNVWW